MRKYLILFVIGSLALVLYLRNRDTAVEPAPVPVQGTDLPVGVALPQGAAEIQSPVPTSQVRETSPALPQPAPNLLVVSQADGCVRETKVKDVLANHEKTWGYMGKDKVKSYAVMQSVGGQGIKDLSALVGKYQACVSLARDKDLCGSLPKVDGKVDYEMDQVCDTTLHLVGFAGYMRGKVEYSYCADYFKGSLKGAEEFITESDFCAIAKEGLPAISRQFCGRFPANARQRCLGAFPVAPAGCKDEYCSVLWSVDSALESNNPGNLEYDLRSLAAAMIEKREASCQPLADAVVQNYCSVKSRIDMKVRELEINKNQDQLNKAMQDGRKKKSED
ncbi:MAG TPA: hypothetical protein DCS63_00840 [Elusimicrobia bacterium]|nr:hypothetical protein [Elusimicrobiota bacterium]